MADAAEASWERLRAARKRRRDSDEEQDGWGVGSEDEDASGGGTLTTFAQRRAQQAQHLAQLQARKASVLRRVVQGEEGGVEADAEPGTATAEAAAAAAAEPASAGGSTAGPHAPVSLLEEATRLRELQDKQPVDAAEAAAAEEARLLEELSQRRPLMGWQENAQGVVYEKPIETGWRAPAWLLAKDEAWRRERRKAFMMDVEGDEIPPPCARFADLKLPRGLMNALAKQGIREPKPIQVQGLPVVLSGRDMIGIAFTGSGKTLVFAVPVVVRALQEETRMPLIGGEGPISLVIVPSRELARQIYDGVQHMIKHLELSGSPRLRALLAIGGTDMTEQVDPVRDGVHIVIATPGRLQGLLRQNRINLRMCTLLALDEADRMIDVGFEDDMRNIMTYFAGQRQTIMFSATMPKKIQHFATSALVKPILVNVGRAGAASLNVVQDVMFVQREARIVELLDVLKKTEPPVLIFAENKSDVDDIHEYLLLKGVRAVGLHGGKLQEERHEAIDQFKAGERQVLVATDVASKGLDMPGIKHVINFDMPKEIENYVHRIGRTGRNNTTGRATTFITDRESPEILLDLKLLLLEAKQRIPPFLADIGAPLGMLGPQPAAPGAPGPGCVFCGGLGHSVQTCPKLEAERRANVPAFSSTRGEA